ncbi:hypothetical protein DVH24_030208 [Malus domestica]|uniref:pectinesterase n=1 Tax=Malus domestica TaxID=3750 RepID=A0A498I0T9_MALDO|nr:hypothetical protein DVH24_030208 [Malus domestica]
MVKQNLHDHRLIDPDASKRTAWAPAALIQADKASFYNCSFISLQDTLTDFKECQIHTMLDKIGGGGYITAQGRDNPNDSTGFVFKDCDIFGTGPGAPTEHMQRVLFASTYMENVINPEGWPAWHPSGSVLVMGCTGLEANMTHRVEWEKQSPPEEVAYWTNTASFIDQDGWLERQPH